MSPSSEIPTFGGKIPCISTSHEPPFAPSDPSTGYNINNMSLMDSVYSAAHKSLGNGLQWAQIFPILGIFPRWGELRSASQHPTGHPLPPATPVLDITSRTCSSWILYTLFARNPSSSDSVVSKQIPPRAIFPHWGTFPLHLTYHPLPPATPILDITSRTCSPWILWTPFARNPFGIDSIGDKSFPTWLILLALGEISLCISAPHLPPFAPSDPSTEYSIQNMFSMDSVHSVCQKSLGN